MHATRRFIKIAAVTLAIGFVGVYGMFEFREYFGGPRVTLSFPEDGAAITESAVDVAGTARNIARITLNGRPIFIDEEGRFSERVVFLPGYNKMTLTASDRFENETTLTREIVFTGQLPTVLGTTTPDIEAAPPEEMPSSES